MNNSYHPEVTEAGGTDIRQRILHLEEHSCLSEKLPGLKRAGIFRVVILFLLA